MSVQVKDIDGITQDVASTEDLTELVTRNQADDTYLSKEEARALRQKLDEWSSTEMAAKIDSWIKQHGSNTDSSSAEPVVESTRTKVIYKDASADNAETIVYIPGTINEATEIGPNETKIIYTDSKTGLIKDWPDTLPGPIVSIAIEAMSKGTDNYELLQNLPYITYEQDSQVHKLYLRGNVNTLIKKLIPAAAKLQYKDRAGTAIEKSVEEDVNIEDIGVGKVRYANKDGQLVEKDIHAVDDVLDLTDIGLGHKVSIITYNGNDNEQHQERLEGSVTEYVYDEITHKTTLKYIDEHTNEEASKVYDGDVIKVVFGFDTLPGGSDYRLFDHIPTITYTDPDTNEEVTVALRGGVDDDITDLLKHAFTPRLYYVDADGNKQDLAGDMTDKLAQPFTAQDIEAIWNEA